MCKRDSLDYIAELDRDTIFNLYEIAVRDKNDSLVRELIKTDMISNQFKSVYPFIECFLSNGEISKLCLPFEPIARKPLYDVMKRIIKTSHIKPYEQQFYYAVKQNGVRFLNNMLLMGEVYDLKENFMTALKLDHSKELPREISKELISPDSISPLWLSSYYSIGHAFNLLLTYSKNDLRKIARTVRRISYLDFDRYVSGYELNDDIFNVLGSDVNSFIMVHNRLDQYLIDRSCN